MLWDDVIEKLCTDGFVSVEALEAFRNGSESYRDYWLKSLMCAMSDRIRQVRDEAMA